MEITLTNLLDVADQLVDFYTEIVRCTRCPCHNCNQSEINFDCVAEIVKALSAGNKPR